MIGALMAALPVVGLCAVEAFEEGGLLGERLRGRAWKGVEGRGEAWKGVEGRGRAWKVMEGGRCGAMW